MLATSKEDVERVLTEAEQIRRGVDPAATSASGASADPADGGAPGAGADGSSPSAPATPGTAELANLALILCDLPFVKIVGAGGQLQEPFRSEAHKAWMQVIDLYLPRLISESGPVGALLSIYAMHTAGLYLAWQIRAASPGSSASAAQESQP